MAINDFQRTLTKSSSQSETATAIGHAEDISAIVTNIDPDLTFFLSSLGTDADATTLKFSWMTEGLKPPQKNAQLEKYEYTSEAVGSLEGKENNIQFFYNSGYITDVQEKVKKVYSESEIARETANMLTRHARDIEYAIVNNATTNIESGTTPAMTGGIPYFMQVDNLACTVPTSGGVITAASAHGLSTGDFVYFTAKTMPTGLKANTLYYVAVGTGASPNADMDTKFRIFDTMKGAVENIVADQVIPTTAGNTVAIVKNNIVDLAGAASFTLDDFDNVMQMCYNRGGNPTMAVMSSAKKKAFSRLIARDTQVQMNRDMKGGNTLNLVGDVFVGDFGTITAHAHRMYPDNRVDCLDTNYWDLKWFERTHQITDIPKKGTWTEFAVASALGLKGTQPKASGSIVNVKR